MKPKRVKKAKQEKKSYEISQSALYKTTSRSKLASILSVSIADIVDSVGDYKRFEMTPKLDPFNVGKTPKKRWVQKPKGKLLVIHERILKLLRCVEVPEYMQFALKGTSYKKNAEAHLNGSMVATLDISDFFRSTTKSQVFNFFRDRLECPGDIAKLYAELVTCDDCIPTGSPLSPLLSYYSNKPLFDELSELAKKSNLNFTCYVDDLTFSGTHITRSLLWEVEKLVKKYGHVTAAKKTRLFGVEVAKHITGTVISDGALKVPNARFRKIRLVKLAIEGKRSSFGLSKTQLEYKLGGLLGEAAYLDGDFKSLADTYNKNIRDINLASLGDGEYRPSPKAVELIDEKFIPPWEIVQPPETT
ncbi:reverse transcriptase family protein [Pseudomonas monsensis]|uniref:Reverse transcriptase family protein n=1 Tax=Pseudomonas monsensis TaxID=2745509 RepID=A0ABT3Z2E2_9PSED|nr:reverse transcriptase family protein [Pseudomonas monsensis]MCY0111949.1 reverse transcriptase family protein [Pseudomonas monsensis]